MNEDSNGGGRFSGLGEALEEEKGDLVKEDSDERDEETEDELDNQEADSPNETTEITSDTTTVETDAESATESSDNSTKRDQTELETPADAETDPKPGSDDPYTTPAFVFDGSLQESIYPRPKSWQEINDIFDFEVRRKLSQADIRNVEGRELHDAVLQLGIENPDRLAELIAEARGVDPESFEESVTHD